MWSSLVMHVGALWVAGGGKNRLLLASLQHNDYYAAPSDSEVGGAKVHGSPHPHHQQMMGSNVLSGVMSIG